MNRKAITLILLALLALGSMLTWQLIGLYQTNIKEFKQTVERVIERSFLQLDSGLKIRYAERYKNAIRQALKYSELHSKSSASEIHVLFKNEDISDATISKYISDYIALGTLDTLVQQNINNFGLQSNYTLQLYEYDSLIFDTKRTVNNPILFDRTIDNKQLLLQIEDPSTKFLESIFSIIITSVIIVVLIAWVYIYLVRVLFRQKSIENMRIDFTHNVTHELKTPIAIAKASNELMSEYGAKLSNQESLEYLQKSQNALNSLSAMVDRILNLSNDKLKLRPETVNIAQLIEELNNSITTDKSYTLSSNVTVTEIVVDRFHFEAVIKNLIDNALKYSYDRVDIAISTKLKKNKFQLQINDTGKGMTYYQRRRIFEKYYRVPTGNIQEVRGHGIGLYYVRKIVKMHSGKIRVSSRRGLGTTFTIELPYYAK